jgi:hypothetical protein
MEHGQSLVQYGVALGDRWAIERLLGLMHKNVTYNRCYAIFTEFRNAALGFLHEKVPKTWRGFHDSVTDNFRVINQKDFRVLA